MVTPEQAEQVARLDAAITATRATLSTLEDLRRAIAGEPPADDAELTARAAEQAARLRRARRAVGGHP